MLIVSVTNQTVYVPLLCSTWRQSHLSFSCNYAESCLKQSCKRQKKTLALNFTKTIFFFLYAFFCSGSRQYWLLGASIPIRWDTTCISFLALIHYICLLFLIRVVSIYYLFFSFSLINSLSINSSLLGHDKNPINIVYSNDTVIKESFRPAAVEDLIQQVVVSKFYSREAFSMF